MRNGFVKVDKEPIVFLDFDNTITTHDVMDDMLVRFSMDNRWKSLEEEWRKGRIGSRDCLKGQLAGIRIRRQALDKYLSTVRIDPYFKRLLGLFNSKNIRTAVLSDNFDYILKCVLKNNGIENLNAHSNYLKLRNDHLIPRFRSPNDDCSDGGKCAHCKKSTLLANLSKDRKAVYIGDGRSDICVSKCADIVFAKDDLLKYYREKGLSHIPFRTFKDIYRYFKEETS